jgi:ATP dependent DNA ligase domain
MGLRREGRRLEDHCLQGGTCCPAGEPEARGSHRSLPELAKAIAALPGARLILDGEVAVFDEKLVSRFEFLAEPNPEVVTTPPVYIAFDVLYARDRDLRARPLEARRKVLEHLVDGASCVLPVRRLVATGIEPGKRCKHVVSKVTSRRTRPRRISSVVRRAHGSKRRCVGRGASWSAAWSSEVKAGASSLAASRAAVWSTEDSFTSG